MDVVAGEALLIMASEEEEAEEGVLEIQIGRHIRYMENLGIVLLIASTDLTSHTWVALLKITSPTTPTILHI